MHIIATMSSQIDIRALRKRIGKTQGEMALYLGVAPSSISHLENGRKQSGPIARLLKSLADAADAGTADSLFPENEGGGQ